MSHGADLPSFRPIRGNSNEADFFDAFIRSKADECEKLARRGIDPEGLHLMANRLTAMADSMDAGVHR